MCRSKAEGGQRCHAHALKNYSSAKKRYDQAMQALGAVSADPSATARQIAAANEKARTAGQALTNKQVELASTGPGAERFRRMIAQCAKAGEPEKQAYYADVLARGEQMRAVASDVLAAYKAAQRGQDVPHTATPTAPTAPALTGAPAREAAPVASQAPTAPTAPTAGVGAVTAASGPRLGAVHPVSRPGAPDRVAALRQALSGGGLAKLVAARNAAPLPHSRPSLTALRDDRAAAYQLVQQAAAQAARSGTADMAAYEQALAQYRDVDRRFLRALPRPPASADYTRAALWASSTGGDLCDRATAWRSLELSARDRQSALVRSGQMSAEVFSAHIEARARARQAVLDGEGRGEFDPVNPRFAAAERARRTALVAA